MRLKVYGKVYGINGRVYLEDGRKGGVEMELSARSQHIAGMDLQEGDLVDVTIKKFTKEIKPVKKKKVAKPKKPVKKKVAKKKK